LVEPTPGAESKLIQVLASASPSSASSSAYERLVATPRKLADEASRASPSLQPGESDKLHPGQLTGALKFAGTPQARQVRRDRLSSAPATLDDRSRSRAQREAALSLSFFFSFSLQIPWKYLLNLAGATVESPPSSSPFEGAERMTRRPEFACLRKINQKMCRAARHLRKLLSKLSVEIKFSTWDYGNIIAKSRLRIPMRNALRNLANVAA